MTIWDDRLQCEWSRWEVIGEYGLALYMADWHCCDMEGAIEAGKAVMPRVQVIRTYSGDDLDTTYQIAPSGQWVAITPAGRS